MDEAHEHVADTRTVEGLVRAARLAGLGHVAQRALGFVVGPVEGLARPIRLLHRRGRDVCVMAPPLVVGRRASECLAYLRGRSSAVLDDRFGEDLLEVLAGEPVEERPSWDS